VEHWIGLGAGIGPGERARWATREDHVIHDTDLHAFREAERAWLHRAADDDRGLYAATVAIDPYRWQTVRFAVWSSPTDQTRPDETYYEVLHLSEPGLDLLARPDPQLEAAGPPAELSPLGDGFS
jgi:hypothetical protein